MSGEISDKRYCSWCFKLTRHALHERNWTRRNVYRCSGCTNYTLECHSCQNMTRGRPAETDTGSWWNRVATWDDGFCAEHDGTIASFAALNRKMSSLADYRDLVEGDKWNLARGSLIAAGALGGIAVMGPLAVVGAPGLAATLGGWGLLGSASTGTAISSLSGAALTSASLAALGGGATAAGGFGMAGGTVVITAVGGALGGVRGGVLTNSYFGDIKGFDITRLRAGSNGERVVFINGFLQQDEQLFEDWLDGTEQRYQGQEAFGLTWESKALRDIGAVLVGGGKQGVLAYMKKAAAHGSRRAAGKLNPMRWAALIADMIDNPWHVALYKASTTGIVLADLVSRTRAEPRHTLMGHSLGARTVYYALEALATKRQQLVQDVFLLGGAVDRRDGKGWAHAAQAVRGKIFNCYSRRDDILRLLYQGTTALLSSPIGIGPIESQAPNIINVDVTDLVAGHVDFKPKLAQILRRAHDLVEPPLDVTSAGMDAAPAGDAVAAQRHLDFELQCPYCDHLQTCDAGRSSCLACGLLFEVTPAGWIYYVENEIPCSSCDYRETMIVEPGYQYACPDCDTVMWG